MRQCRARRGGVRWGLEYILGLRTFAKYFGDKQERDRSEDKATIEETFGGIWIDDTEEFAKFVSAVNTYPTDENGEGIAKTSDYLYLYYRGIGERIIPFASVYLNKGESQNVANELINAWNNGEKETVRDWLDWLDESYRNVNVQGNVLSGRDEGVPITGENGGVDNKLSRKGRYYYTPEFYSKVKRIDSGSAGRGDVNHSLFDIPFLDDEGESSLGVFEVVCRASLNILYIGHLSIFFVYSLQ